MLSSPPAIAIREILTGQVLSLANGGVSPGVIAAVSNAAVLADPDEAVGAVVELLVAAGALPVAVAVGHVGDDVGLALTGVFLLDGALLTGA